MFASLVMIAKEPVKVVKNAATVKVNTKESTLKWHATKVTGEHNGTVNLSSGELMVQGNQLTGGNFAIDMTSILDLDLTGEYKGKLEGHLKSEDFFSVDKFPTAELKIKSVTAIKGAKATENNYTITADLTIKGITKEITFPAQVIISKKSVIANATLDINRAQFDVRYGSNSFFQGLGDKAIADIFNVKVRLVGSL